MFQTIINNVLAFIMSIITAFTGGAGDLSSMSSQNNSGEITQSRPSPTTNRQPQITPDANGCVKNTPDYFDCKQRNSSIGKKNHTLN